MTHKEVDLKFIEFDGEGNIIGTFMFNEKLHPVVMLFDKKMHEYLVCVLKKFSNKAYKIDFGGNVLYKRSVPKAYVQKFLNVLLPFYDEDNLPVIDIKKFIQKQYIMSVVQSQNWKTVTVTL
jgi:hypothetical protein